MAASGVTANTLIRAESLGSPATVNDPEEIVREGFDALGEHYLAWELEREEDSRLPYLERFASELPDGARVLDLGCGPGVPATKYLAQRFDVTGLDVSEVQLALARRHVPGARFIRGDLAKVSFADGAFDGVAALFAIAHSPRAGHGALFRRIAGWLTPGGVFLASMRAHEREDLVHNWGGVRMYSSNYDADTTRRLLRDAGFELVLDELAVLQEIPDNPLYLWVMGKLP
jgi:SAM-dependent methyltransferase